MTLLWRYGLLIREVPDPEVDLNNYTIYLGGCNGLRESDPWFVSTKHSVVRLDWEKGILIDRPAESWLEIWSHAGFAPLGATWSDESVTVRVPSNRARPGKINLLHITDLHIEMPRASGPILGIEEFGDKQAPVGVEWDLRSAIRVARKVLGVDVVLVTGDVTDHGTASELIMAAELMNRVREPVLVVPGNHDHYGGLYEEPAEASTNVMGVADTKRFERHIGPRWWARLLGDGLIVGLDWFSWRLRLDRDEQRSWLESLAGVFRRPRRVVLAIHDEFDDSDWEEIVAALEPHRVTVILSGHWHVSRVHSRRGYLGYSGGSLACGGLHLGPPECRVVELSEKLEVLGARTLIADIENWKEEVIGVARSSSSRGRPGCMAWMTELGVRLHRTNIVEENGLIVVAGAFSTKSGGLLVWLDAATGEERRTVALREGCIGPVATSTSKEGRLCICSLVDGTIAAFDWDGRARWEVKRRDAVLRYSQTGAVVDGQCVIAGDTRSIECIDLESGMVLWRSESLGASENLIAYGEPVIVGQRTILPLGGPGVGLVAIDLETGEVQWREGGERGIPASSLAVDGGRIYLLRSKGTVECVDLGTGEVLWSSFLKVDLGAPAPLIAGDYVLGVTSDGYGGVFDKDQGRLKEVFRIPSRPMRLGPYRNHSSFVTGLGSIAGFRWISCGDGSIWTSLPDDSPSFWRKRLDANVLTTSAVRFAENSRLVLLGFSGTVLAYKLDGSRTRVLWEGP